MSQAIRTFFIAALAAAIVSLVLLVAFIPKNGPFTLVDIRLLLLFLLSLFVIASVSMILVAVPLAMLLSRTNAERAWIYRVFGFLTGCAVALAYSELPLRGVDWALLALAGGLPGTLAGEIWWVNYRKSVSAGQSA